MTEYVLALDQGTTSSRAILFDASGAPVTTAQREFEQLFPRPGWVEHRPEDLWASQVSVAAEALGRGLATTHRAGAAAFGLTPPAWGADGFFGPLDDPRPLVAGSWPTLPISAKAMRDGSTSSTRKNAAAAPSAMARATIPGSSGRCASVRWSRCCVAA